MPTDAEIRTQRSRWRSMHHVGTARPRVRVFIRKGHLQRSFQSVPDSRVYNYIPGMKGPNVVWLGEWHPDTDYVEVPNVLELKGDNDFGINGVETLSMTLDNVVMKEESGVGGLFHSIKRGYMAPQRGFQGEFGTKVANKNEWFDKWKDKCAQIAVVGGYGEEVFPLFVGLVDKVDLTSRPDRITVTARNMGQFLTDQHTFMDAKHLWVRDPITFADRLHAQERTNVATAAESKSRHGGHPPRFAVDDSDDTTWLSGANDSADNLEWLEIPLPAGRYINCELYPAFPGLEVYISIHCSNNNVPGGGPAHIGDGPEIGENWLHYEKLGDVPGTDGIPYVQKIGSARERPGEYDLTRKGRTIVSGANTRLRFWFRNLHKAPTEDGRGYTRRAGVRNVKVWDRRIPENVEKNHWILVDDAADIVKTVLTWCGITDWDIESTGVRLKDKLVFDRQTFLIDIIRKIAEMTSYVFYVKAPDDFDVDDLSKENVTNKSMGVAVFRQNSAAKQKNNPGERRESVSEANLITGIQASFDSTKLANSIRVRGKEVGRHQTSHGGQGIADNGYNDDPEHIHPLGADRTKRYQYNYRPVWARSDDSRQAALRLHELHYDQMIDSLFEAKVACLLIAFRMALESAKAEIQIPFFPPIQLDQQILIYDTGTGTSGRIWIVQRGWEYRGGESPAFTMSLGGSLLDVNDITETRKELERLLHHHGYMPQQIARGPWEDIHKF